MTSPHGLNDLHLFNIIKNIVKSATMCKLFSKDHFKVNRAEKTYKVFLKDIMQIKKRRKRPTPPIPEYNNRVRRFSGCGQDPETSGAEELTLKPQQETI